MSNPISASVDFDHDDLLEVRVGFGDALQKPAPIASIYVTERSGGNAVEYHATSDGVIPGRHFPPLIKIGDFIKVIARIVHE